MRLFFWEACVVKELMEKLDEFLEWGGTAKKITFLAISLAALLLSIFNVPMPFEPSWIAVILCGIPIVLEAIIGLVTEFDIKADVLVAIALIASLFIGEDFAAGEVAFIMQLGELLEELTVKKARAGIERLAKMTPETARIISKDGEKTVPVEEVRVGDILRVLPGEAIPLDGVITAGQTSVNQAVITGEALPVDKAAGDEVSGGTVNQFGAFEMRVTKAESDSTIQRMIKMVEAADAGKAKIVGLADRWATWIVVIALSAALLTGLITGEIIRAVTILVVFCPCALVLATPTAVMAAIGNVAKHGFWVREGDALERLATVTRLTFDKTGTLTYGTPVVKSVVSLSDKSEEELFLLAASVEKMSEHPLGKAIVKSFGKEVKAAEGFKMIPGEGVSAFVDGKEIKAGGLGFAAKNGEEKKTAEAAAERYINEGCTVTYISCDGALVGLIALSDKVREESEGMVAAVKKIGITPVLLTGDNENAARSLAASVGIGEVRSSCLPEDKLNYIADAEKNGDAVCMIGDGINDAPALRRARVGIAMGGVGSDIATDAADIVLADDEVKKLPHLIKVSGRMMVTIKCNITFSMLLNFAAIILAATGKLNPVLGALVHNAGSVLVIINSALLLKWKNRGE